MTVLLDGNVLVASAVVEHVHHTAAVRWFDDLDDDFATCPITQGTLLRLLLRMGRTPAIARDGLRTLTQHSRHRFWPDSVPYDGEMLSRVLGHRQVTDSYLAALARANTGRLATFDEGLATTHPDVAVLIQTPPAT